MLNQTTQRTYSALSHLECAKSHKIYDADKLNNISAVGSPLLARYDLKKVQRSITKSEISTRPPNMWRYCELLPVREHRHIVSMAEGYTPMYELPKLAQFLGLGQLLLKDESTNPGDTFKARGASVAVSRAVELGAKTLAIATNGNAGEALAMYGARAGIPTVVIMPADAQQVSQKMCAILGARIYLVQGQISDAAKIVQRGVEDEGWFDVSTLQEPYRIEGKKTMGYEIVEQLGWRFPDAIVFPTGGGIAIAAMYKAFLELQELGWVTGPFPQLIAVQASGCAPLVKAFHAGKKESEFFYGAQTFANGLRVPKSFGDFMVLEAIYATNGYAISVSDEEISNSIELVSKLEGVLLCPEAAAVVPGVRKLLEEGAIKSDRQVVLIGTGSSLKYIL
jgi:threonine synthase